MQEYSPPRRADTIETLDHEKGTQIIDTIPDVSTRAHDIYEKVPRKQIETDDNIGKILLLNVEICEQVSREAYSAQILQQSKKAQRRAALAHCDAVAEQIPGEFDSAEDLRRIREEKVVNLRKGTAS